MGRGDTNTSLPMGKAWSSPPAPSDLMFKLGDPSPMRLDTGLQAPNSLFHSSSFGLGSLGLCGGFLDLLSEGSDRGLVNPMFEKEIRQSHGNTGMTLETVM